MKHAILTQGYDVRVCTKHIAILLSTNFHFEACFKWAPLLRVTALCSRESALEPIQKSGFRHAQMRKCAPELITSRFTAFEKQPNIFLRYTLDFRYFFKMEWRHLLAASSDCFSCYTGPYL